ncbi:phosphoribosylformimino-5-aminoimidazole carboxamide ribotide isomerase [Methanocaldococcus vulcanius M7]|uniref:1-(5-phosphoribosyl)-5-[(5-phosphoribosylamino)methylideneamino] imidazole-4-carboxamide isomerase n=1 Tax=Methanocaldococcus vulcanius (strain ATCC 700851 / DSM 12094 / M7) TaxID=579137 RepID=C9RH20_METVM|nr:1-(5-phosphoribosyl)-5-[(5-phosphoribosylamino)methylideneamino]imidazole-4-carboxamide isomerase [Methanocaldococcus vulcanius]ACX72872.1 phosphoribosylformimino-5-aminoimidazole carboxamide ribotide isomerase [Methanocaldococcus vulcanius M7]
MIVIPAVDLKDKKCVQLIQGDPTKKHLELEDPVNVAKKWVHDGAEYLHIVDLDAALGCGNNVDVIEKIVEEVNIPVEVGGGIRSLTIAKRLMDIGVDKIVVGTKAITDPTFLNELLSEIEREKIILAVECKQGKVAIKGWKETINKNPIEIAKKYEKKVGGILFTNVDVEGMLSGIKTDIIETLVKNVRVPIIYSGGITTLEDIKKLKEIGVDGVIIGSALYKGIINLKDALKISKS